LPNEPEDGGGKLTRLLRDLDPRVIDVALALVMTAAALANLIDRSGSNPGPFRKDDLLGVALVLAQTLPLAVRSIFPLGALFVIGSAIVTHSALGYAQVQAGTFSSLIAVYSAAWLTDNRRGLLAAMISGAAVAGFFATNRGDWSWPVIASTSATWVVAWFAGTFVRIRGEQLEVAGARATRAELERDARAREAVADERARMARELHDIVGHALNLMVVQASGALRVFDSKPELVRDALGSIESSGREALSDMERMLGVLRATDSQSAPGPQPGLAQLTSLAANISEAGIQVDVKLEGDQLEVPASVDLSAYRIVQEALTNCLKHSGASHASVTVRYGPDDLEVEVVDNGRGAATPQGRAGSGGRGQLGMRERAALFGGEITIGPVSPSGGYRVRALLPFKSPPG
jgi:signal transduction histidine kinase